MSLYNKKKGKKSNLLSRKSADSDADSMVVPTSLSLQDILQMAIKLSLTGGDFVDTKFYVYSRRTTSGIVKAPRAVYANSLSLRKISGHFERLLSGGFAESRSTRLDVASYEDDETSTYEYDSDSDLEDEDDYEVDNLHTVDGLETAFGGLTADSEAMRDSSTDAKGVTENPATSEDGAQRKSVYNVAESSTTLKDGVIAPSEKDLGKSGKTVFIRDIAFNTWKAFVFYVYFDKVSFAPLRSQKNVERKAKSSQRADLPQPPECSPKSMYRLADKYDLTNLRELAKNDLKAKLSEDNILTELFSEFTSRYHEILDLEIQYISSSSSSVKTKIMAALPPWLGRVSAGELPNSADVLLALFGSLGPNSAVADPKCPYGCNTSFTRNCNSCRHAF